MSIDLMAMKQVCAESQQPRACRIKERSSEKKVVPTESHSGVLMRDIDRMPKEKEPISCGDLYVRYEERV